jgi:hypothetical protein
MAGTSRPTALSTGKSWPGQDDELRACPYVRVLEIQGRRALFHEERQELVGLNETAWRIWRNLADGLSPRAVAVWLTSDAGSISAATLYVNNAVELWLSGGWLEAKAIDDIVASGPSSSLELDLIGARFSLQFFGASAPASIVEPFSMCRGGQIAEYRLQLVSWRERWFLLDSGKLRGWFAVDEAAPAIKNCLTKRLSSSTKGGFLGHGALLANASKRLFVTGPPGAGKSTLALALAHAGLTCLSDDIVLVQDNGWMSGAPFALTLKAASWPVADGMIAGLDKLPVHRRPDGALVRYLPHVLSRGAAAPIDVFISLREDGAAPSIINLSGLEAMLQLLEGAFAKSGAITSLQVTNLARVFDVAKCFRLTYAESSDAVAMIVNMLTDA